MFFISPLPQPQTPIEATEASVRGEQALWRAVISQAVTDAISNSTKKEQRRDRAQARYWLLHNRQEFALVCHFAGLDPHYVRQKAQEALQACAPSAEHSSKRKANGQGAASTLQTRMKGLPPRRGYRSALSARKQAGCPGTPSDRTASAHSLSHPWR